MSIDPQTYFGVPYRSVVTALDGTILTFLDSRASDRSIDLVWQGAGSARGKVPSFDPEINSLWTDSSPYLSFANRLLFMLRRDGSTTPYNPRFAGILSPLQRQGGPDNEYSTYTAFDPWQILYYRPAVKPDNTLIDGSGWWAGGTGDAILTNLLDRMLEPFTILGPGGGDVVVPEPDYAHCFIDWGWSAFYEGTIETTDVIQKRKYPIDTSVGQVLDDLVGAGLLEVELTPIYDPKNRPGVCCELSIYATPRGSEVYRNDAIFAWDTPGHSLSDIDVAHDGYPINRLSVRPGTTTAKYVPLISDSTSYNRFGDRWLLTNSIDDDQPGPVGVLALAQQRRRRYGKTTLNVTPIPGRSPVPLIDYKPGDYVPVWGSTRLGEAVTPGSVDSSGAWTEPHRIYAMTIDLSDNDYEHVSKLTLAKDDDATA